MASNVSNIKPPQGWEYFQNLKNNWSIIKVNLLDHYPQLTKQDLEYKEGEEEKLVKTLESKLGKTRLEVERLLQDIALSAPPKSNTEQNNKP